MSRDKSTSREECHIRTDVDNFRAPGEEYDPELFMIDLDHYSWLARSLPWELSSNFKYGRTRAQQIMWLE